MIRPPPADGDFRELGRCAAVILGIHANANSVQAALCRRRLAPGRGFRPAGEFHRAVQIGGEFTRGHDGAARHAPGQIGGLQQVAPAQGEGVDVHFLCRLVDQAFQNIIGLQSANAAIGPLRRGVGDDAPQAEVPRRYAVAAAQDLADVMGHDPDAAAGQIGPMPPIAMHPQAQKTALFIQGQFAVQNRIPGLKIA